MIASLILISSCEKEIDISLSPAEKKIVMNSFFNNEEFIHVNISSNQPSTDGDTIDFIDNARVLLYEDDHLLDTLTLLSGGEYVSDKVIPGTGLPYKLTVEVPGLSTASTDISRIPENVKHFAVDTSSFADPFTGKLVRHITLKFKDIENTSNYYLLQMVWVGTRYEYDGNGAITDSVITYGMARDYGQGQGFMVPYTGKLFFSDELMEGDTIERDIYFAQKTGGPDPRSFHHLTAYIKLCTISEEYYLYAKSYADQSFAIDYSLFVEPVSVFSNIHDGYGIFAGYGQCIDSVLYCE